jgi:NAD(P)H-quinone oxidoreductase subunit 5
MTASFLFVTLVPLLPAAAGLACRFTGPRAACRTAGLASWLAVAASLGWVLTSAVVGAPFPVLSAVMVILVSFLGARVIGFSRHYLDGDPGQSRFLSWMCLTLASVLVLVLATNLLVLLGAWIATSLCLHRLLLFYPERAGAQFSARKKFVFSRMGDLCLLGSALLLHARFGTFEIGPILTAVSAGQTDGLAGAAFLLAGCAMLKSAQFPFHSWLPDTMETPTPVSAFMHAGIINAGGFLIVRFAPVLASVPAACAALALVGACTAAFGAVVMLAQPSVKQALAFSTIAQMGFMLLQCGLGAYGLAVMHIVAHSLYKAHAFLMAGSTVGAVPRAAIPLRLPALTVGVLAGGFMVMVGTVALRAVIGGSAPDAGVFGVVLALALAYGVARALAAGGWRTGAKGFGAALAVAAASLILHSGSAALFGPLPGPHLPRFLLAAVGCIFAVLFLFQSLLWRAGRHPLGRKLYVHALNGFYVSTVLNRLLGWLWPSHPVQA